MSTDLMTRRQHIFHRDGWPMAPRPTCLKAHVITNIGRFVHCRKDKFCRCRKCKPPLQHNPKR